MAAGADSLGVAVLELTADPTPLNAMLASSERRTEMSMARMEAMSGKRLATVGQNMSRLGSQWTRSVSLPIVAGGAAMVKVASDFQGALTQVQTQAGASAGEIENMRKAILKLAPAVGQTPVDLAKGLFQVESAGLRGAKALDVLTQAAKLAKIGHSDLEQTTGALVAVMRSAPKDVKNATDAIGLMNAVVGQGRMHMGDLVGALSTGLIPAAKSAGLGLRDVGAALDVMTNRGVPAQDAATRLRMTISLLSAPSTKAASELKTIGLSSTQLAMDMRKPNGLVLAVTDLKKHLDAAGLSAVQQNQVIAHAFGGGRSSSAILTLLQNTTDLQKAFTGIGQHSGAGVVAEAWKKTQEDIGVRLDKLKAKATAAFVDIGTKIAPEFIKVGTQVADDATKIANAFSSLPKGAQDLIITGGLTAAAMGPVLRLAGVLTTFAGRTWDALKIAKGLAAGDRTLFGNAARSAASGMGTVATMEVGTMVVRGMVGGALPAGAAPIGKTATATEVAAAEAGAAGGFRATAATVLSRVVGGAGLALFAAPLALALGAAIKGWINAHALDEGKAWADKFTAPLPKAIQDRFRVPLAKARESQLEQPLRDVRGSVAAAVARGAAPPTRGRIPTADLGPTAKDLAQTQKNFFNEGWLAGKATIAGLHSVKFTSAPTLIRDFMGRLRQLPAQARPEAAKVMIQFAQSLERSGKLPKHSVDAIIASLEESVKGLGPFLAQQGLTSDKDFAKALKFTAASKQLKDTLDQYRTDFGDLAISTKITGQNINDQVALAMRHLRQDIAGSSGEARRKYQAELDAMKRATNQTFDAMASKVVTRQGEMTKAISQGSKQAAQTAGKNFGTFRQSITNAMSAGIIATNKGMQLITKALNATLKAFGEKPLAVATVQNLTPAQLGAVASGQVSSGAAASPHASGGLIQVGRPGEKGHDTVPMNVGGMPIMVAPGEKVAVFNDAQQHVMNRRLADYGGLPGFFSRVNRPHYMARGGFAKGGYTGYSLPLPRSMMSNPGNWSFDQGVDIPGGAGGEPEFAIGPGVITQEGIGGFGPNAPILRITAGPLAGRSIYYGHAGPDLVPVGAHVRAGQQISSVGRGIVGMSTGPHIEIGFWPPTGGANFAPVLHQLLGGAGVTGVGGVAGSAAALTKILAPHVKGKGTIANIVRAALGKAAGAANAYEAAHAPAAGVGMAGVSGAIPSGLSGGVERQIFQALSGLGWNKIAIAGAIGNAAQESSMNPAISGGGAAGLWQWTPGSKLFDFAAAQHAPWQSVGTQAAKITADIGHGGVAAMNAQGSPGAAAAWLMNNFERPLASAANLPHRIAAAIQAYAQGYAKGGWVRTGATEDNFTGGPMQTGYPTSYNHGNTFAQLLMGGANAGRHPNLSDLLGMGGGILPAGFPIDIRYGGRELDDVRRIDTGSGALDGSTHWTVDIESPAARRLRFPGKGDIMVRAHGKSGKGADPHAGMHRVRYWQKGAKHKHPGRWAHKWVKNKPKSFKLPKFHAMAGFDPSDMAKIQAIDDYLNNKLSPWQGLITGIHGRVPVPPKSVADRLAEIGHLGDPPDLNTELGIDQKFLDEYFTESVLAGQAQQKFLPWLTKMLKDRKTQQDRIDDTQATINRLTYLKSRLPQERKDRDYAISTRFQLARHKLQTSSARGTFDAGQLLSDQLSGLSDEEKKARQAIPSKPPAGWSGTKAGWAAQRNRELGNVSSEFADRRAALKKAAKEHKFEGRLARSNALFGLTQEERAEKHQLSDVFSGRALAFTERLKDRRGWLARYKRLLTSDETALTAATGSKDGTVVTGSGSFEDILLDKLDPMGSLAINIATKKDIDIPTLLDEINTLKGTDATTGTGAQLATLLQQQNANLEQQLAVSQDQYKVLARLPPFGGSFLSGGVVPGMLGEPRTIIAHGGETISPAGAGDVLHETHVHVTGPGLKDLIDTRVEHKTRAMSRAVKALPGARAGQLSRR